MAGLVRDIAESFLQSGCVEKDYVTYCVGFERGNISIYYYCVVIVRFIC